MIQTSSPGGIDLWRSILDKITVGNIQGLTVVVVPAATLETLADLEPGWQTGTKKHLITKESNHEEIGKKRNPSLERASTSCFSCTFFCYFKGKKKVEIARV